MGTSCEKRQSVATERKQITANDDMGFSQAGAARGQRWGVVLPVDSPCSRKSHVPLCPPETTVGPRRPSAVALFKVRSWCDEGGGYRGSLKRAEQGTEIKRGRGPGPRPRDAAPSQAALGSRTGGTRPRAGGSREGQEGPQVLKQKAHRQCSSSVTCVSKDGWPRRCMHDYDGERTTGELTR